MSLEETRRQQIERRRNILYLIAQYLADFGFNASYETFFREANLTATYRVCDNVDLDTIYLDYCSHYQMKFEKQPRILKKIDVGAENHCKPLKSMRSGRRKPIMDGVREDLQSEANGVSGDALNAAITVSSMGRLSRGINGEGDELISIDISRSLNEFLNIHPEHREMAEILHREIIRRDCGIKWADIQGNDSTKQLLYDTVVMPLNYPGLFKGIIKPWRGILLHGPSGTGKTLMAKALCSETQGKITFFNVAASTITSKWRGDSEKFIRVLFEMAKFYGPSVIFMDEVESLTSKRDSPGEHEASRRFKNEFLTEIDSLDYENANVLLLVNSNLPWEIDLAFLRRFERKILVDLPQSNDRIKLIQHFLPSSVAWSSDENEALIITTDGFTGAEIRIACKEASLNKIKQIIRESNVVSDMKVPNVSADDLKAALELVSPSMAAMSTKHQDWNQRFGSSCTKI